jgi:hypothetical protein
MWYVSIIDGARHALLLGPFQSEEECREWAYGPLHWSFMNKVCNDWPLAWFAAWGMARTDAAREGKLNHLVKHEHQLQPDGSERLCFLALT